MNRAVSNILRFVVVIIVQVVLLNHLHFTPLLTPMLYVWCLLMLPVKLPKWAELLIGFGLGLLMDISTNTLGLQTFSCVLIAFLRPMILRNAVPDWERLLASPTMHEIGWGAYLKTVIPLTFLHHSIVILMQNFSLAGIEYTLANIFLSTIVAVLTMIVCDLFLYRP